MTLSDAAVKSIFDEYHELAAGPFHDDPSGLAALGRTYPKVLLLASASFLEVATCQEVSLLYEQLVPDHLQKFVAKGALERKYHAMFDWNSRNANKFFSMFGEACRDCAKGRMKDDNEFAQVVGSFIEIGFLRNNLVHQNYASFVLDKTFGEVWTLHCRAREFPSLVPDLLSEL